MAEKLTKAQRIALSQIAQSPQSRIRFPTGEALRKAGLVERETLFLVGRDYATKEGIWPQWRGDESPYHEWWITPAGRAALEPRDER